LRLGIFCRPVFGRFVWPKPCGRTGHGHAVEILRWPGNLGFVVLPRQGRLFGAIRAAKDKA